ncbi:MAG: hypothetical protein MJ252_20605 [archaeon]|nr:hypothetical protein [archaeon]
MEIVGKNFKLEQLIARNLEIKGDSGGHSQNTSSTRIDSVNYGLLLAKNNPKRHYKDYFSKDSTIKNKNFIEAFSMVKATQIDPISLNSTFKNINEFSLDNVDNSLEDNVEFYLHKPLIKAFKKEGNDLLNIPQYDNKISVNIPYNLQEVFRNFMPKITEVESEEEEEIKQKEDNPKKINNIEGIPHPIKIKDNNEIESKTNKNEIRNQCTIGDSSNNFSHNENYKKSTAISSPKNNKSNIEFPEVEPFGLINDLDEDEDLVIDYQKKDMKKTTNKKNDEILIMDSLIENKKENTSSNESIELNNIQPKNNPERNTDINQYFVGGELYSSSNKTISGRKVIPKKFSFSKLKLFEWSEGKTTERKMTSPFGKIINEIRGDNKDDIINKNLLNKFNNCLETESIKKNESPTPSAELLKFTPEGSSKGGSVKRNEINNSNQIIVFDEWQTPIKKNESENKKEFFSSRNKKNIFFSSKSTKLFYKGNFNSIKGIFPLKVNKSYSAISNLSYSNSNNNSIKLNKSKNNIIFPGNENEEENNSEGEDKKGSLLINSYKEEEQNNEQTEEEIQYGQTVYDLEFYNNLLSNERRNPNPSRIVYNQYNSEELKDNFLLINHPEINNKTLLILYDWIMQISEEFAFKRDTFHYCINYINRYLYKTNNLKKEKVQLIGVTCLGIAAKIEEVQIPKLIEYSNSTENIYSIQDIIECEKEVLKVLQWKIVPITINCWLNWYICQWDLFIETIEDNKNILLSYSDEDHIMFFKKSNDNSYYNFRRITQMLDLILLDFHSEKFKDRYLIAALIYVCLILNYNFEYDFENKKYFGAEEEKFDAINKVYSNFLNQSFDFELYEQELIDAITFCGKFKDFDFSYDLPLLYQVEENDLETVKYIYLILL